MMIDLQVGKAADFRRYRPNRIGNSVTIPVTLDNPCERAVIERWCAGFTALRTAADSLGIEPEAVIWRRHAM
ncbi:hypothetical protein [Rhizobium leguminosarum]|uniref:hypothetical protein n=1 Tax=Rhizobium leguminosarum TaxID=384 RepID=UPI001C94B320|nr:hypothetical protein [Rhizobium leguminosarum]MBY5431013.1 hypothetical protein [Rhizobium leguminosarum]